MLTQSPNSATLPEFPVEDLNALLRNSGAPALVAIGNEDLFWFDESLNNVGVGDIAAEMDVFYGESAPSPIATPLPDQQPPVETEEPIFAAGSLVARCFVCSALNSEVL